MLLVGLLLAWTPLVAAQDASLQGFLGHLRAERDARYEALRGPVAEAVRRLEELGRSRPRRDYERLQQMLRDLGREAAPLLALHVDPGDEADAREVFRAEELTRHLREFVDPPLTRPLLAIARSGSATGRTNALDLLGKSSDVGPVSTALAELYATSAGDDRLRVFRALVQIGGDASRDLLGEALGSSESALVATALEGLTERRATWAQDSIRSFLDRRSRAAKHVPALIAYFQACPSVADEEICEKLLDLAASTFPSTGHRRLLMEALPDLGLRSTVEHRSQLSALADDLSPDLREGALTALTLLGERGAKRKLLRPYDDAIDRRKNFATAYEERAAILMRVRDYSDAVRDFKKAIEIRSESSQSVVELSIDLARAHALSGKLRQAADVLEGLVLGAEDRAQLRVDPAFAELIEHSRYGKVLADS